MNIENEITLYVMFYAYLKENGYTPDQDPDEYWEYLEDNMISICTIGGLDNESIYKL